MPSHTVSERRKRKIQSAPRKPDNPALRKALNRGKLVKSPSTEQILKAKRKFIPKKKEKKK